MRVVKYLVAPWVGIILYILLTINFGAMGLSPYRRLMSDRDKEKANLEKLETIHQELESLKNALLYDEDTQGVYARELGFAPGNEKFIRIVGLEDPYKRRNLPGEVITASSPEYIPDSHLRGIALAAAVLILVLLFLFDTLDFLRRR